MLVIILNRRLSIKVRLHVVGGGANISTMRDKPLAVQGVQNAPRLGQYRPNRAVRPSAVASKPRLHMFNVAIDAENPSAGSANSSQSQYGDRRDTGLNLSDIRTQASRSLRLMGPLAPSVALVPYICEDYWAWFGTSCPVTKA